MNKKINHDSSHGDLTNDPKFIQFYEAVMKRLDNEPALEIWNIISKSPCKTDCTLHFFKGEPHVSELVQKIVSTKEIQSIINQLRAVAANHTGKIAGMAFAENSIKGTLLIIEPSHIHAGKDQPEFYIMFPEDYKNSVREVAKTLQVPTLIKKSSPAYRPVFKKFHEKF